MDIVERMVANKLAEKVAANGKTEAENEVKINASQEGKSKRRVKDKDRLERTKVK
eukprot:jgi/Antlo1/2143/1732